MAIELEALAQGCSSQAARAGNCSFLVLAGRDKYPYRHQAKETHASGYSTHVAIYGSKIKMGLFARPYTCTPAGLPIEAGTPGD